nr:hypothetical protein [Tanacetum cinerariifolium]
MVILNTLLETCTTLTRKVEALEQDKIAQALEITKLKQRVRRLKKKNKLKVSRLRRLKKDVILEEVDTEVAKKDAAVQGRQEESQAQVYHIDLEHADKVLSMQDDDPEPDELKEVIEVVTTAKLMTEVVTDITSPITTATITAAPSAARRRKGEPKPLKKQVHIEQDKAYVRELEAELNKNINWDDVIEHAKRNEKEDNAVLRYQALKRKPQTEAQARKNMMQAVKKQKFNEDVEELKKHLQIILNDEDDVFTEATPLDLNVPVVDYQIHTENNKPYYKVIRADGTHQLFLSFLSLLRNFDKEALEVLWQIVQERFASSNPKNFSYNFLLTTLKAMFEKPDVEAHIWKNQRGIHG